MLVAYSKYDLQLDFLDDRYNSTGHVATYESPQGYTTTWNAASGNEQLTLNELVCYRVQSTRTMDSGIRLVLSKAAVFVSAFEGDGNESLILNWKSHVSVFR